MNKLKKTYKLMLVVLAIVALSSGVMTANKPYISKVYDFMPAPGQFVNVLPEYADGDTKATMIAKVEEQICGNDDDGAAPGMITLGGFGGYVVFGFDHRVINVADAYDFKVYGNAFAAGSSEPGIVMVSYDANGNGEPDDEWYELAGSDYNNKWTQKNYTITYYRPDENKEKKPDPSNTAINDMTYVRWTTSTDSTGYVMRNTFHKQSYYPQWVQDDEISFTGTRLPNNGHDTSGNGSNYVLNFFDWGYVDNRPNDTDPGFKIDWAVDSEGKSVNLHGVDFIKVYSAENQYCGWIGETSTEVCGAEDLHPNVSGVEAVGQDNVLTSVSMNGDGLLSVGSFKAGKADIYSMAGTLAVACQIEEGLTTVDVSQLANGVYVIRLDGSCLKFIKR